MSVTEHVTAIIPIHHEGREDWLQHALSSLPKGMRYIVARNDGEIGTALTQAAQRAKTEWLLLMGADDAWEAGSIDYLWRFAQVDADVVYPTVLYTDEEMTEVAGGAAGDEFCGNRLQVMNYVPGCGLIRRSKYLEVGGTRDLDGLEDWDLWVRLHRAGARFKACRQAHYYYRQVPGSRNKIKDPEKAGEFYAGLKDAIVGAEPDLKATFYYQATPATTYLRCILPARYLPGQATPNCDAATVANKEVVAGPDDIDLLFPLHRGKAAVFQFAGDKMWAAISAAMQADGMRVLVEVDDNYLTAATKEIRKRSGWERNIGEGIHSLQGHGVIVKWADGVICTTDWLANQYRKVAKEVFVCPNTVDPADWPAPRERDDVFRIGWFASLSHKKDIPLVTRAMEWASRQKDVQIITMGLNPRWRFRYGYLGWVDDLAEYRYHFGGLDAHVCPVRPDPWSQGRSDIKALEGLMGGSLPIVSDVAPYKDLTEGENCLKARDARGFLNQVKWCVEHREEARELARRGREWVIENRSTASQIHLWEQALAL